MYTHLSGKIVMDDICFHRKIDTYHRTFVLQESRRVFLAFSTHSASGTLFDVTNLRGCVYQRN